MRFVHTNIVAKNWKELSDFYIGVFGCRIKPPVRKLSGEWLDEGTGLENASLEGVHLLLPGYGDDGPTLEIFSYKEAVESDPMTANRLGITHIAFEVDDLEETLYSAVIAGARLLGRMSEKDIEGVGVLKFVYFKDPEGNIIEIQSWVK
jgi:catechol 2,3-dioxygenase-like lactoylglutathione lyase family enzyme